MWFADVTSANLSDETIDTGFVAVGSIVMFVLSAIAAGSCLLSAGD